MDDLSSIPVSWNVTRQILSPPYAASWQQSQQDDGKFASEQQLIDNSKGHYEPRDESPRKKWRHAAQATLGMKTEFPFNMIRGVLRVLISAPLALALNAILLAPSVAFAVESTAPASAAHIDAAIDRLNAPTFLDRETAAKELLHKGSTAIPQLESALKTAKGETRYRIRSILERQRLSTDNTTRRAAEQALVRIAASKDPISASWAQSILSPSGKVPLPTSIESTPGA